MASNLNVTELDFDTIKQNLKNFLKQQNEFNDYDFEGSGLNILLDVLAYNTHYNAMNAHFSLNEAFLDSAQIRGNVVTRAKLLGYVPRSVLSPRAVVNISVDVSGVSGTKPTNLDLPRGTKLNTIVDGEEFQYVVLEAKQAKLEGNLYSFTNVNIVEGSYRELKYRVDNDIENQKFQLSDKDADTSTLRVRVQQNQGSTAFDIYTKFETLKDVDATTKVYFLQENPSGFFEIYFGDGVTGYKPVNDNIVTIDYVKTKGSDSNGASVFTMVDQIGGFTASAPTLVTKAAGGSESETTESIRFNAPLTFIAQNRAVTSQDYSSIIKKSFTNIDSIATWGGEDQEIPDYGRIYIAIKPLLAELLTEDEKAEIKETVLKGKNVVSVTPIIVDPVFTRLELDVGFKYNPNLTDRSSVELTTLIKDVVSDYNFNNLNKFDGVFRHSELTNDVDTADPAILNSSIRPRMFQNIIPTLAADGTVSTQNHTLNFAGPFFDRGASDKHLISSTAFKLQGSDTADHFFGDRTDTSDSNKRIVIVYKVVSGKNVTVVADAGEVNISKGTITLNNFIPTTNASIKISVIPDSLDIAPKREQLLMIDSSFVTITPEIDTIATAGSSGSITYTTTSRIKS